MNGTFLLAQDQTTRELTQQIRQQIEAARAEALAAGKAARAAGGPVPPTPPPGGAGSLVIPFNPNQGPPQSVVDLSIALFITVAAILIFWPITRAIARRISSGNVTQRVPAELSGQLAQLTQAVDAIAVEVERISEGQRFTTRLLTEQRAVQSGTILSPVAGGEGRPANQG